MLFLRVRGAFSELPPPFPVSLTLIWSSEVPSLLLLSSGSSASLDPLQPMLVARALVTSRLVFSSRHAENVTMSGGE